MSSKESARPEQSSTGDDRIESVAAPKNCSCSLACDELKIMLRPDWNTTEYFGTRAQLETEGLIPAEIRWPIGIARARWNERGFEFVLAHARPDGFDGPRRGWVGCDYWSLTRRWQDCPSYHERVLRAKAKELRELLYRETSAGREENSRRWRKYIASQEDEAFQAFKRAITDLIAPPAKRSQRRAA